MLVYKCDHCGKELNPNDDYIDCDFEFLNTFYCHDLCASCRLKLQDAVDKTINIFVGLKYEKENYSR